MPLHITLGPQWRRHALATPELTLLGIVQEDAAIGALARRQSDGRYLQVNGDVPRELDKAQVEHALREQDVPASQFPPRRAPAAAPSAAAPTVTVKRRRSLAVPQ